MLDWHVCLSYASSWQRRTATRAFPSSKRRDPRNPATQDQSVDIMCTFIGVDRFKVHHVADHLIFPADAIAAMHVARLTRDIERFTDIVALDHADHVRRKAAFVHQATDAKRALQAQRDVGQHICQLLLVKLLSAQRACRIRLRPSRPS